MVIFRAPLVRVEGLGFRASLNWGGGAGYLGLLYLWFRLFRVWDLGFRL